MVVDDLAGCRGEGVSFAHAIEEGIFGLFGVGSVAGIYWSCVVSNEEKMRHDDDNGDECHGMTYLVDLCSRPP